MIEKFECTRCGWCCKNLSNVKDFKPGFTNSYLIAPNKPNLFILPWEKQIFPKENVVITKIFFDLNNNLSIVLYYGLNTDCCPLIKDNSCSVHDNRALHCIIYPCPIGDFESLSRGIYGSHEVCEAELPINKLLEMFEIKDMGNSKFNYKPSVLAKKLYERYGVSFIYKTLMEMRVKKITEIMFKLESRGIIKLARKGIDVGQLMSQIKNSKKVDADDFIKEKTGIDLREMFSEKSIEAIKKVLES